MDERFCQPLHLEIAVHLHCSRAPFPRAELAGVKGVVDDLTGEGLVEFKEGRHQLTDRGRAWLELLLRTQPPRAAYVDNDGKEIKCQ